MRAILSPLRCFIRNAQCTRVQIRTFSISLRQYPTSQGLGINHVPSTTHLATTSCHKPLPQPRAFSASSSPTTLADPSRPSLFYHFLPAPNPFSAHLPAYAVTFFDKPPKDSHGPAVLGWLPATASAEEGEEAGLGDFKENPKFLNFIHQVIQKAIEDEADERLKAEAVQLGQGWMHINDDRNVPAMGRISSPDDIIASVRVEDGKMLPETYSPMPAYRTCTADGLSTLSESLESRLLMELKRVEQVV